MDKRIPKGLLIAVGVLAPLLLIFVARTRPGYFTDTNNLGGLILLEFMLLALWNYRQMFFVLVVLSFLFAGSNLPMGTVWTAARWFFLAVGAAGGLVLLLKDGRRHHFGLFHAVAFLCVLAAVFSAGESRYSGFAIMKVLSLSLLFLYAASGARLAAAGREEKFVFGLVTACEWLVGISAAFYILLRVQAMGNPNSLGAIMGVVAAPVLLWGVFVAPSPRVKRRRMFLLALCTYLVYYSHARAGMMAGAIACGLLCIGLRKYRVMTIAVGVAFVLLATSAIVQPEALTRSASAFSSSVIYKEKRDQGLLGSRQSPWQSAIETIQTHIWFGTGFGTNDNGQDASEHLGNYATISDATKEHGSSYLAIASWVGLVGVVPFFFLLFMVAARAFRVIGWLLKTGNAFHPAVPIALVMIAGLIHASFEDWMFAVGYYLCVFYWGLAFVLIDLVPARRSKRPAPVWAFAPAQHNFGAAAPNA